MRYKLAILLPTAIIIMAEALFFQHLAEASLELHLLNIFICIMLSIFLAKGQDLYLAFVMVSLLRVLNIGMPKFLASPSGSSLSSICRSSSPCSSFGTSITFQRVRE